MTKIMITEQEFQNALTYDDQHGQNYEARKNEDNQTEIWDSESKVVASFSSSTQVNDVVAVDTDGNGYDELYIKTTSQRDYGRYELENVRYFAVDLALDAGYEYTAWQDLNQTVAIPFNKDLLWGGGCNNIDWFSQTESYALYVQNDQMQLTTDAESYLIAPTITDLLISDDGIFSGDINADRHYVESCLTPAYHAHTDELFLCALSQPELDDTTRAQLRSALWYSRSLVAQQQSPTKIELPDVNDTKPSTFRLDEYREFTMYYFKSNTDKAPKIHFEIIDHSPYVDCSSVQLILDTEGHFYEVHDYPNRTKTKVDAETKELIIQALRDESSTTESAKLLADILSGDLDEPHEIECL